MPNNPKWRPSASRLALEARAAILADIRRFFAERNVMEVETPTLSSAGNSDPNIQNLATDGHPPLYLRTSPEYPMKRLLASGCGDIYELGRVFRAGEAGRHHNIEFTMLEWYRLDWTYLDLANEVIDLIRYCGGGDFDHWQVHRHSFRELFQQSLGLDPWQCSEEDLAACAAERGVTAFSLSHQDWLDLLLSEVIQPGFEGEAFTVIYDYPPEQAALARIRPDDPPVAERFEVYLGQMELANGYQELTDAVEQLHRFEREVQLESRQGLTPAPLDRNLIAAMQHGLPECAGVALGVDRLLLSCLKLDRIDAVLSFSGDRA